MISPGITHRLSAFLIILMITSVGLYGQEIKIQGQKMLTDYDFRVKQFNEFIDRFNYKTAFNGEKVDASFMEKVKRTDYLRALFNLKDPRLDKGNRAYSEEYQSMVAEFIDYVSSNSILLQKHSEKIIAEALTKVIFNRLAEEILIYLNQEVEDANRVRWVVSAVNADFLNVLVKDTTHIRFIPPSSNELNFINLKRAMEDRDHLDAYAGRDFKYDPLSVFFFNINTGKLTFEHVIRVAYYIFDIPGWCIKVREFNRTEMNSGWLIDDIIRTDKSPLDFLIPGN